MNEGWELNRAWELIEELKSKSNNKPVLLCDYDCEVSPDHVMLLTFDPPCLIMMGGLKDDYLPPGSSPERVTEEELYEGKVQCREYSISSFPTRPKGRALQEVVKVRLDKNTVFLHSARMSFLISLRAAKARLECQNSVKLPSLPNKYGLEQ